jgi:hypothetical protein
MALFCNTTRIVLLMEKVPWKLLVQVSHKQLSPPVVRTCASKLCA